MPKSIANKFYKNVKQFSFDANPIDLSHPQKTKKENIISMILLNKLKKTSGKDARAASREAKNKQ